LEIWKVYIYAIRKIKLWSIAYIIIMHRMSARKYIEELKSIPWLAMTVLTWGTKSFLFFFLNTSNSFCLISEHCCLYCDRTTIDSRSLPGSVQPRLSILFSNFPYILTLSKSKSLFKSVLLFDNWNPSKTVSVW